MRSVLKDARIWVVKVGTRVCLDGQGRLNGRILLGLASQIAKLRENGCKVVLVSSGAIGMGRELMKLEGLSDYMPGKQALAAIGQVEIMNGYKNLFSMLGIPVAQVLITRDDVAARDRYLNARNALDALLDCGVLPVINENDSVSTGEIRFGDNDSLAATVGSIINADVVVNLTSVPGILAPDPDNPGHDRVLKYADSVTQEIEELDKGTKTSGGTGGLSSKLRAARMVLLYGAAMVIAQASEPEILTRLAAGEELGTLFSGPESRLNSRKRWLADAAMPEGKILVDAGACKAVSQEGASLLTVGITEVRGDFRSGDLVYIAAKDTPDAPFAKGLCNYSADELSLLAGHPSSEAESILGHAGYTEAVHCSSMVLL